MGVDAVGPRAHGLFRGDTVDVRDPEHRMRVLVSVPEVFGEEMRWAEACAEPNAGSVPAVGQQVWVMFERGSFDAPVWLGVVPALGQQPTPPPGD